MEPNNAPEGVPLRNLLLIFVLLAVELEQVISRLTVHVELVWRHVPAFLHFGPHRVSLERIVAQDASRAASTRTFRGNRQ